MLRGQKRFIVGAEGADYFLVYARTDPGAPPRRGLSAFLVERGPGVEVSHVYGLMDTRGGGTGRAIFRDARVPRENLVGEENGAALEVAARYSTRRRAFGRFIREFQGVSFKVADSLTRLDTARGVVYAAARAVAAGRPPHHDLDEHE